jgi:branched-chain amino acid transport system permease protein
MAIFSGDVDLWYEIMGQGRPLILVHGNAASSRWWDLVYKELSEYYRAIRVDLRGFGQSEKPDDGYTVEQLASDLAEFGRFVVGRNARWVGHSLGGSVLLQLALDHPELIEDLILVDPGPADGMPLSDDLVKSTELTSKDPQLIRQALEFISPTADHEGRFFDQLVKEASRAVGWIPMVKALRTWNIIDRIGEIEAPILVLEGSEDVLVPPYRLTPMLSRWKDATMTIIPGVGHCLPLEDPARLVTEIKHFRHY